MKKRTDNKNPNPAPDRLRIQQLKLPVLHTKADLDRAVQKAVHSPTLPDYKIVKQSVDARDKSALCYSYSIEVSGLSEKQEARLLGKKNIVTVREPEYDFTKSVAAHLEDRTQIPLPYAPVIVGTGPAGLFCGYCLAKAGFQPILLERGKSVQERVHCVQAYWNGGLLDPECNVQFGEGGAGTFSDGKLNTMIRDKEGRIGAVLRTFAGFGASGDILYVNKPHIGTDVVQQVVQAMREEILRLGGQVWFDTCFMDFVTGKKNADRVESIIVRQKGIIRQLPCQCLILAIGHSARDTVYQLFDRGVLLTPKAFAVGLRIEHEASMIQAVQYGTGREAASLPAADYKLTHQTPDGRAVYTFCMCPGGYVIDASSEPGRIAVNGMSNRSRNARNSNSAIVVNVTPADFEGTGPLAGIEFQRKWERQAYHVGQGKVPVQLVGDYKNHRPSVSFGGIQPELKGQSAFGDLNDCLPKFVNSAIMNGIISFDKMLHGFGREDAVLSGIESRTSSPVRIERDQDFVSNIRNLFPCGEGAGYAGGITSAAVDGIRVAEAVAAQFCPSY